MTSYRSSLNSREIKLSKLRLQSPLNIINRRSAVDRVNDQNETGWADFPALMICLSIAYLINERRRSTKNGTAGFSYPIPIESARSNRILFELTIFE